MRGDSDVDRDVLALVVALSDDSTATTWWPAPAVPGRSIQPDRELHAAGGARGEDVVGADGAHKIEVAVVGPAEIPVTVLLVPLAVVLYPPPIVLSLPFAMFCAPPPIVE